VHLQAARAARYCDSYDEAIEHLDACNRLNKGWEPAVLERVLLRAHRGDLDPFLDRYLQNYVLEDHPDTSLILEALALGYQKTYRLVPAHLCLDLLLTRQPELAAAWYQRGQLWDAEEEHVEAEQDYRHALELDPDHVEARLRLAGLVTALARPREAVDDYEYLQRRQADNPAVLTGLANCHFQLGEIDRARQLLDQVLAAHPHQGPAVRLRGHLELHADAPTVAEAYLREAIRQFPDDPQPYIDLALCLRALGKQEESRHFLAQAEQVKADMGRLRALTREMAKTPHDAELRYQAGRVFIARGLDDEGLAWFRSALHEDPRHPPTHRALAEYYDRTGDSERASYHRRLIAGHQPGPSPSPKEGIPAADSRAPTSG
jgi:tetratricopeptide (TPR) repeat protein